MKRRSKTFAEMDVVSRYWRKQVFYLSRPGVTSAIKRQMRRRERREGKRAASSIGRAADF